MNIGENPFRNIRWGLLNKEACKAVNNVEIVVNSQ
jgi:hypothetical protein